MDATMIGLVFIVHSLDQPILTIDICLWTLDTFHFYLDLHLPNLIHSPKEKEMSTRTGGGGDDDDSCLLPFLMRREGKSWMLGMIILEISSQIAFGQGIMRYSTAVQYLYSNRYKDSSLNDVLG